MQQAPQQNPLFLQYNVQNNELLISLFGAWRIQHLRELETQINQIPSGAAKKVIFDGEGLESIDTSGALLLFESLENQNLDSIEMINFREDEQSILKLVQKTRGDLVGEAFPKRETFLEEIGHWAFRVSKRTMDHLSFIGRTLYAFMELLSKPSLLRKKELFVQLEQVCVKAVPVVALVTFLIGVVIAYLFSIQTEQFGASIFIVDAVSIAMCRELSPIIVAIIVAGRSGSAFTAQLGTMKLNEEVDAMETLGLSPMQVLVVPRVLALALAMPLLVFVGDIIGILGGMLISDLYVGITGVTFIERLQTVLPLNSFYVGLIKAPVFAAFIAMIGCKLGLTVENNARSVGAHTTATVVESIVAVILLNAFFAVIFVELGI